MPTELDVEQRWPELFVDLDDIQRRAVAQSLANASREAQVPNREDVKKLTDEVRNSIARVSELPAATAMDLVRMAQRGTISHDELVKWLKVWPYEPRYVTQDLADDGEFRGNSTDALRFAYIAANLISREEYHQIHAQCHVISRED